MDEWPPDVEIVEEVGVRSCIKRGKAIDLVLDRARENRSQFVYTTSRGRPAIFWQSQRTRKQARPRVTGSAARASGLSTFQILIDSSEKYPYRFADLQVSTQRHRLAVGDYAVARDGRLVAVVERKSMSDLVSSLLSGRLRYQLPELAAVPRAAILVEERYSQIFKQDRVKGSTLAEGVAELQVRWPSVPIAFCDTRAMGEQWTYRFLAAALTWIDSDAEGAGEAETRVPVPAPTASKPSQSATVRSWALEQGYQVSDRGKIPAQVLTAYQAAHPELDVP